VRRVRRYAERLRRPGVRHTPDEYRRTSVGHEPYLVHQIRLIILRAFLSGVAGPQRRFHAQEVCPWPRGQPNKPRIIPVDSLMANSVLEDGVAGTVADAVDSRSIHRRPRVARCQSVLMSVASVRRLFICPPWKLCARNAARRARCQMVLSRGASNIQPAAGLSVGQISWPVDRHRGRGR